jgi:plasmid stabilization system protein ParE
VTWRATLHADAASELEAAAIWYDERHAGLGLQFLVAIDRAVEHARAWPHSGAVVRELPRDLEVRRLPVTRFPYHLVYLPGDEVIHVLAVAHNHRRPGYWKGRGVQRDE